MHTLHSGFHAMMLVEALMEKHQK